MRYARAIEQITGHFFRGYAPNPLRDQAPFTPTAGEYFRIVPEDTGTENQLEAIVKGTDSSVAKLKQVVAKGDQLFKALPESRRVFFNDNLLVHAKFMLHLNEMLNAVTRAFMTLETGAGESTVDLLDTAANSLDAARLALDQAEHGRFTKWYDSDTKFKIDGLEERIQQARDSIQVADG